MYNGLKTFFQYAFIMNTAYLMVSMEQRKIFENWCKNKYPNIVSMQSIEG